MGPQGIRCKTEPCPSRPSPGDAPGSTDPVHPSARKTTASASAGGVYARNILLVSDIQSTLAVRTSEARGAAGRLASQLGVGAVAQRRRIAITDIQARRPANRHRGWPRIQVGSLIEVRSRFDGRWVDGFGVAEIQRPAGGALFRLRRQSDGALLPALFFVDEIRPRYDRRARHRPG